MAWQPLEKGENNFDVVIIGAGISGINFGYRLKERCPNLSYTILEARHEIGGTWSLFKYPGIRSDSDLFTFGFAWKPWASKNAIAEGDLIRQYVQEAAAEQGIDQKIKYHHSVSGAQWSTANKTWTVDVTANKTEKKTFKCRFVLFCTGYYDYDTPLETIIPGIDNFKGQVIHPQFWPENLDYDNKDVVIIGSGATAITVLPSMSERAKSVTMLQRSPSWIMAVEQEDVVEKGIRRVFGWWPSLARQLIRTKWILAALLLTRLSVVAPERVKTVLNKGLAKSLPSSIPRDPHFTPRYNPWEQRMCMCPDGDFFKSLRTGKGHVATGVIKNIDEKSITLDHGQVLKPDIIVTATGLKLKFVGGVKLSVDGKPYNPPDHLVWKGQMLEDLPNAAFVVGYVDASWTLGADATAQLITRMLNQMKKENVVEVRPERNEQEKKTVHAQRLMRLQSTYLEKGKDMMPKAGDKGAWLPRGNFISDIFQSWYGNLHNGTTWVKAS